MIREAGISGIGVATPENFLRLEELAKARGLDPNKYIIGIGQQSFTVPSTNEDAVTLAADALDDLLEHSPITPTQIGRVVVGTETGVDNAKAIGTYLMDLFPLPRNCETFEIKQACIGGTYGLIDAMNWAAVTHRPAVVICTDISKYKIGSAENPSEGEPTQGAGAVALLVTPRPSLLTFDVATGTASGNEHTFYRPLGSEIAVVDGHRSVQHYLAGIVDSMTDYLEEGGNPECDYFISHVPYTAIAKKAFAIFSEVRRIMNSSKGIDEITVRCKELREDIFTDHTKAKLRELYQEHSFLEDLAEMTAPSLSFSRQVGNIYTGSMYLALASLLADKKAQANNKTVLFYSFGSGSSAKIMQAHIRNNNVSTGLHLTRELSVDEYEALRRGKLEIKKERGFVLADIDAEQRRHYTRT